MLLATAMRTWKRGAGRLGPSFTPSAARRMLAWLGIAWLLAASAPKLPLPIPATVDGAWYSALNLIHRDGGRIGPDIAFTMGPLGYLTVPDPAITPWWQPLLLRAVAWFGLLWGILRLARTWPPWAAFGASAVLCSAGLLAYHYPDTWQASYLATLVACAAAPTAGAYAVAGLLVGVSLLLKANEALTAFSLYGLLVVAQRRRLPKWWLWFLALPPAILLGGAWAFNGGLWTVFPYVRWALEAVRGFTEAASIPGPLWQLGLFLLLWGSLFAVALLDSGLACLRQPAFWCALLQAFQSFKHGFVRQDGHADLAIAKLAAGAFFLLAAARQEAFRKTLVLLALFGCGFTWFYMAEARTLHFQRAYVSLTPGGIAASARNLIRYGQGYAGVGAQSRELHAGRVMGEPYRSLIGAGSIDAFPDQIDWIRANGWNYRARPTIDSITAFTGPMNERNGRHFAGPGAPEFVLFFFEAIDGRHPMMQDTSTLRALLSRYEVAHEGPQTVLLKQRKQPRRLELREMGQAAAGWQEPFTPPPVSGQETLWASFDIVPSPWGRLRWFFFRTDPPLLQVHFRGGDSIWIRLLREIAREPMPLSPLPRNLAESAMYLRHQPLPPEAEPARLVLHTSGRNQYGPRIRIRWYAATR